MRIKKDGNMKFALFLGCNIPVRVQQYELSARAVLDRLEIGITDIEEFKCCGNPIRNTDHKTFILMASRNLALAEKQGLNMLVLCKCCFGSLKKAINELKNVSIRDEINEQLAKEGLHYSGTAEVKHLLSVLYHDIGVEALKAKCVKSFKELKIATHYGCHALRPSEITGFDNPVEPVIFDKLVSVTGAKSIAWPLKLECCGAPMLGVNDALSISLTRKKIDDGKQAGADYLCVACPYCQMQFDRVQQMMESSPGSNNYLPSIVYPQLLGLAMGIEGCDLGLNMNLLDISTIESFLKAGE
jgi:heterodisulfide reductase subunit B2